MPYLRPTRSFCWGSRPATLAVTVGRSSSWRVVSEAGPSVTETVWIRFFLMSTKRSVCVACS